MLLPLTHSDTDYRALYEQALATIAQKDALIAELRSQLTAAEGRNPFLPLFDEKGL